MEKDMSRRCSHCGLNGHNSRTCSEKGVKLFGVTLTDGMIRKSVSMGNLALYNNSQQATQSSTPEPSESGGGLAADHQGYVSDGLMQSSTSLRERKKGVPWTEHEHRMFLVGLQRLGKGDWRGISRNFVTSRTPTQVASHAQKYFLRQCNNLSKRKRRSSLFDIISSSTVPTSSVSDHSQNVAMEFNLPTSGLSSSHAIPPSLMETVALFTLPPINPAATATVSPDLCLGRPHLQPWQIYASVPSCRPEMAGKQATINALHSTHSLLSSKALDLASQTARGNKIIRPTATLASSSSLSLSSSPSQSSLCRIDEAAELSSLSLSIGPPPSMEPSELSLKLEQPSRHSAFHSSGTASMAGNAGTSLANAIRVV